MADNLGRPHGIALSPDQSIVYLSDMTSLRATDSAAQDSSS
jgi:sugar lactone lactonase YvrE